MKTFKKFKRVCLGKVGGKRIYLSPPSWDCGWYWGFGYLGNKDCHYHVKGLMEKTNLFDGIKQHFDDGTFVLKQDKDTWILSELFATFYALRKTAEVLGRGGSHYTSNPCKDIITNKQEVKRINEIVLPAIFDEIYKLLNKE